MPLSPLTIPVLSNFIKDFPAQNTVNCDNIDAYAGPCLITHPLQTYVPILSAVTTNPVLGTPGQVMRAAYYRIFDQIYSWGDFRFGTGFSPGSGSLKISLPFDADTYQAGGIGPGLGPMIGSGYLIDASAVAGRQTLVCQLASVNEIMFTIKADSGAGGRTVTGNNNPITWAINDGISWWVKYRRAA